MSMQLLFWILMLLWLILGGIQTAQTGKAWFDFAIPLIPFILFALLGWQVFGAAIK
jgi:hypothetical protein